MSVWQAGVREDTGTWWGRWRIIIGRELDYHRERIITHREIIIYYDRTVDEDKYRCAVWEQLGTKIFLSLSQDASCNSLFSTREGRTLVLYPG